jgi:hypothetical protein
VKSLETRPTGDVGVKWVGTHKPGMKYTGGNLWTKGGSLWLRTADTEMPPGNAPHAWRLIVKEGLAHDRS